MKDKMFIVVAGLAAVVAVVTVANGETASYDLPQNTVAHSTVVSPFK